MANPKSTLAWFAKASSDLRAAKYLLSAGNQFWNQIAFQCQQSAEKAIKGFLTFHSIKFGKTHDIEKLLKIVASQDQNLTKQLIACEDLTKFAVAYRYPDAQTEPLTQASIDSAIRIADSVYERLSKLAGLPNP